MINNDDLLREVMDAERLLDDLDIAQAPLADRVKALRDRFDDALADLAYYKFLDEIRKAEMDRDPTQSAAEYELKMLTVTRYCRAADAAARGDTVPLLEFGIEISPRYGKRELEIKHDNGVWKVHKSPLAIKRALKMIRKLQLGV